MITKSKRSVMPDLSRTHRCDLHLVRWRQVGRRFGSRSPQFRLRHPKPRRRLQNGARRRGGPAGRYLISCCFFSHAAATTLLSALSTATCLFMSFSSAWVSFALLELSSRASVPSSLLHTSFR